jgi:hexosaminidase
MNAKLLVWDEMADVDLPVDKTIVFWWRHDKPEQLKTALNKGYATVLCPRLPFYFDFVQDSTHRYGRKWNKLYNSLKSVYDFSAEDIPVAKNKTKLILGMQANLWTETVPTLQRLGYLLFPRITALAEAAWTAPAQRNYQQYLLRLQKQLPLYQQQGIYYYDPFSTTENPEPPPVYRK